MLKNKKMNYILGLFSNFQTPNANIELEKTGGWKLEKSL